MVDRRGGRARGSLILASALVSLALVQQAAVAADGSTEPEDGVVFPGGEPESPTAVEPATPRAPFDPSEPAILDEVTGGEDALGLVGDRLDEVAARNGLVSDDLERILLTDDSAHLDRHGLLFYVDPAPDPEALAAAGDPVPAEAPFPYADTFLLNSKPGSKRTIYLDFNGHTLPDNNAWTGSSFTASAYDFNGVPGTFTNAEKDVIQSVWQRVAEDYAAFDVNVTTQDPGFAAINRSSTSDQTYGTRALVTNTFDFEICGGGCGGVAYLGVFDLPFDHTTYQPAWCFSNSLFETKAIAECVSHEVGHNLGLDHDGQIPGDGSYYEGHEPWAPIMGVGYYEPVVQFSKGEYADATNTEGDFSVMASHGVKARTDDHTNTDTTSSVLIDTRNGIVSSSADYDLFSFTASSTGEVTFVTDPAPVSPNLDVVLKLYSSSMALLTTNAPAVARVDEDVATGMGASITHSVTSGVTYYLQVSGGGHLTATTGYTRYGSIGQYELRAEGMVGLSTCGGLVATMQGTSGAETITGTTGADVIDGLGGADVINGLGGNDIICGGDGFDTIDGGAGADEIYGDSGADVIDGGAGNDTLSGIAGNDTLNGEEGADDLSGGTGADTLYGGNGVDDLSGGDGADPLNGGGGNDTLDGNTGADTLRGNDGADDLNGGSESDKLYGGDGVDVVTGGGGNDTLNGDAAGDQLHGGVGADTVNGIAGNDKLWGDAGSDTLNGGIGSDNLYGGTQSDVCNGNAGTDTGSSCEVKTGIP